ncbi:hypothetical protein ACFYUY_01615 [Kitasatospora sp. NPDC004745]|uniref:hypothetical protein n=1 Tax=Kitasatospora sp. NPDC004745 TaxID=3364019 RepID=UPI0036B326CD
MATVTTTNAAAQAGVTADTIRTWCRTGAVAAIKKAGRWVIDAASLAYRIKLPALLRKTPRPVKLTAELVVALGGRRWQKNGMDRVYLNNWAEFADLDVAHYGTGNVSGAALGGRGIANGRAARLLSAIEKVWFDTADGRLHAYHDGADAIEIRYLDGARDTVNLLARTFSGIKAAAATL